jgi:hypothetical protein
MIDRLFVIIGAGASFDCVPVGMSVPSDDDYHPPLTPDLFRTRRAGYASILAQYPLAKAAAAELATVDSAVSLETQLRERYRDSEYEHDRRIFRGVLPYLQDLLYTISHKFTDFPQNYEVLVTKLLRLKEVVFVSLNYDLFLDNTLLAVNPDKSAMSWYIRDEHKWSLIKLHGSVDWGRELQSGRVARLKDFTAPEDDARLAREISLRRGGTLDEIRGIASHLSPSMPSQAYFPALAVPVGQADELVCPPEHVDFLKQRLAETQAKHVLVIGYSGLDQEVVSLIRESGGGVKTLTVVDRNGQANYDVVGRLAAQGIRARDTEQSSGGFNEWIHNGELDMFVKRMSNEPF